jgi:ribulose kinase
MSGRLFLGVDIGTYSAKGVLVRQDGTIAAAHVVEHALDIPGPGRAEHDPEKVWWRGFVEICRSLLSAPGVDAGRVEGVRPEAVVRPLGDASLAYQDTYRVYRALYDQNAALMHELARLGR